MKTMSLEEFRSACKAQAVPTEHIAVKCPICKTLQSGTMLIAAGAGTSFDEVEKYLGFSCIGRFTGAGGHKKDASPGSGCNWTLGGLFKVHQLEVETEDGQKHPRFELATPEEAQQLMKVKEVAHAPG